MSEYLISGTPGEVMTANSQLSGKSVEFIVTPSDYGIEFDDKWRNVTVSTPYMESKTTVSNIEISYMSDHVHSIEEELKGLYNLEVSNRIIGDTVYNSIQDNIQYLLSIIPKMPNNAAVRISVISSDSTTYYYMMDYRYIKEDLSKLYELGKYLAKNVILTKEFNSYSDILQVVLFYHYGAK